MELEAWSFDVWGGGVRCPDHNKRTRLRFERSYTFRTTSDFTLTLHPDSNFRSHKTHHVQVGVNNMASPCSSRCPKVWMEQKRTWHRSR